MSSSTTANILPSQAARIIIWHRGALGDVLLAAPAWQALAAQYPRARLTLVGGPAQLGLFTATLPVAEILDGSSARWLDLFQDSGPLDADLTDFLGQFDLALVFMPRQQPEFLARWRLAGIPRVVWVPSFAATERTPIRHLQENCLKNQGLTIPFKPFHLIIPATDQERARWWRQEQWSSPAPLLALAPGSGHRLKNWPLASFITLAERLEEHYGAPVWWVLGPAESALEREMGKRLDGRQFLGLRRLPLRELAGILAEFALFVGNDSGVTHLAAALRQPRVVALFGPSDPVIWAPPGATLVTPEQPCAPCTSGRPIPCPENRCLTLLPPGKVMDAIRRGFPQHPPLPHNSPRL